jgi:hypothetical protein
MMASASATVLFGLGRLDDGSVGPDRFSKDQGEREASPTEENSPVEQLNALPTAGPFVVHCSGPSSDQAGERPSEPQGLGKVRAVWLVMTG